jgi:hypothetical protein
LPTLVKDRIQTASPCITPHANNEHPRVIPNAIHLGLPLIDGRGRKLTGMTEADSPTRIILVPSFAQTGIVVLLCLETLECRTVGFEVPDWVGSVAGEGGREEVKGAEAEADGGPDVKMQ